MPVDFLTEEQKAEYGQFAGEPNETQLARYFLLDEADLAFISDRRGEQNRFGFALQITAARFLGTFPSDLAMIPVNVKVFVANQLSIRDSKVLEDYAKRETTRREHTSLIRKHYGYHEFHSPPWSFRLSRLLYSRAWISNERPSLMFDFATAWLIQHKVLLPGASTLSRLISEVRERATNRLWRRLSSLPTAEQKSELDKMLEIPEGQRTSQFDRFRKGPVTISGPSFNEAVERYKDLQSFGMQDLDFTHFPPARLKNLARHAGMISMYKVARMADDSFQKEMVEQYGRVRRFLPKMLSNIIFKAAPAGHTTLEALNYLAKVVSNRKQILDNPPMEIISGPWKRLVFDKEGRVNRRGYTLCFLDKLQDALRRRDIYVEQSDRWGDPRAKLLQGTEWQANRVHVCRALGHPIKPQEAVAGLVRQLDATYKKVAANFDDNVAVSLDPSSKKTSITITNLEKMKDPESLTQLNAQVRSLIPAVDLTELLLEIHTHTGFADEFTHVSESNARAEDLGVSICAILLAEACNIGMEPLVKHQIPALTRHRLSWTKQNYLRAETLTRANARLVNYQSLLPLAKNWGGGEVASADGMRFVTPIRTINAGPNRKYFGSQRGITWYNFVSDQYAGFHGIVIPGTLRDSIFVLEGLLEQQTGLNPTEIMTDTSGTSNMVFGLFWLLGYQFSPRLADAGEAVFCRVDKDADYGVLNDLARSRVNIDKIEQHWDDMMRIAGSLKLGTVQASELIRSLLKSVRPSSLAQAIIEAGRINKTLYLLNYIDDEDYRRRILIQLNRGEGRHSVARTICYGQRGEIRKRYREGQEDQLGALGLVTNALILWNTIYMQAALDHLREQAVVIHEEDETRLSPLVYGHVNMLGHYSFTLADIVRRGKLRPLNQPGEIRASA